MHKIIIPGEEVDPKIRENTFTQNGKTYAITYGLLYEGEFPRIVPLKGKYLPEEGDLIVGLVTEPRYGGATVDINSPYSAYLKTPREYEQGDVIAAEIIEVSEQKDVILADERIMQDGEIMQIEPVKIPRVIGKKNSMVTMIKEKTQTDIFVGKNGRIWIKGPNAELVKRAIQKIEKEAHTEGLTERVTSFLENKGE